MASKFVLKPRITIPVAPIIIIIFLITLLSIYVLGNLHLSQIVSWINLNQGKKIHPIH